jgi:hypothetical protein
MFSWNEVVTSYFVIPAKAGNPEPLPRATNPWTPAFAGVTTLDVGR